MKKANLLDTAVTMLRRYLFTSMHPFHSPTPEQQDRYEFRHNDALNQMNLERHTKGSSLPQHVEVEVEATERDVRNIAAMKADAGRLTELAGKRYINLTVSQASKWDRPDTQVSPGRA